MCFDPQSGTMVVGDVGQNLWEEVTLVKSGTNGGWRAREGMHPNPNITREDPITADTDPIVEYQHRTYARAGTNQMAVDNCIIGGFVYRGGQCPTLSGWYLYADYSSGRIWGMLQRRGKLIANELLLEEKIHPSSFGEDADGEMYVCDHGGTILKVSQSKLAAYAGFVVEVENRYGTTQRTRTSRAIAHSSNQALCRRGYDATTTASIAEAAGITEPVLYRHFENKKDLYLAVLRTCSGLLLQRWKDAAGQATQAPEQVRRLAATIYGSLPEISDHQRVIYGAVTCNSDPDIATFLREHVGHLIDQAMEIVKLGQQQGIFRQDMDLHAMSWAIMNIYTGFSFTRLHVNPDHMDLRVVVEVVLTGLYARNQ